MACIYNEPKAPVVRRYLVDYSEDELKAIISLYKARLHEVETELDRRLKNRIRVTSHE